jgi:hypothetical protein
VNFHLEKLHPHTRQILEAGAVLGQSFDFEAILMTAGRAVMETLDSLDELAGRQFLVEQGDGYHFCHAIVRGRPSMPGWAIGDAAGYTGGRERRWKSCGPVMRLRWPGTSSKAASRALSQLPD